MKFDREGDVRLYLVHSIVVYKGRPAEVIDAQESCGGEFNVVLRYLNEDAGNIVTSTEDSHLSLEPPSLGYINTGEGAVYLKRHPTRYYKRGLASDNVRSQHFSKGAVYKISNKDYPVFKRALWMVRDRSKPSAAFSTDFAVTADSLLFKGKKVGRITASGTPVLGKKFYFLSRRLKESLNV